MSLESVVQAFQDGSTPEEICLEYPSLDLVRVYSVLAYYLLRRDSIDTYLRASDSLAHPLGGNCKRDTAPFLAEVRRWVTARRAFPSACA